MELLGWIFLFCLFLVGITCFPVLTVCILSSVLYSYGVIPVSFVTLAWTWFATVVIIRFIALAEANNWNS